MQRSRLNHSSAFKAKVAPGAIEDDPTRGMPEGGGSPAASHDGGQSARIWTLPS